MFGGYARFAIVFGLMPLLSSCFLDRSGIANPALPAPELSVQPNLICAGEEVAVRWRVLGGFRDDSFCSTPDGGVSPRTACRSDRDCPTATGAICLDGLCILPSVDRDQVNFGGGCIEPTTTVISAVPGRGDGLPVPGSPLKRGFFTDEPVTDTTYSATVAGLASRPLSPSTTRSVTVVPEENSGESLQRSLAFAVTACGPGAGGRVSLDLHELTPEPIIGSPNVLITSVRNDSPYDVTVQTSDPNRGPVLIRSGVIDISGALNGEIGREWHLTPLLTDDDLPSQEDCQAGSIEGGSNAPVIQPAVLTLTLICRPPD